MSKTSPMYSWLGLLVSIIICFAVAGLGAVVTTPNISNWYATLAKPAWTPPDWLFGPVWSILYFSMAIAAWLVWRQNGLASSKWPLAAFAIQLLLNCAWSWLFFGLHNPCLAFLELLFLWAAIIITIVMFWRKSVPAGILLLPYLLWVTFAGILNFTIWQINS
jgi:translocator protein